MRWAEHRPAQQLQRQQTLHITAMHGAAKKQGVICSDCQGVLKWCLLLLIQYGEAGWLRRSAEHSAHGNELLGRWPPCGTRVQTLWQK
jgi:hypothetical protein